LLVEFFIGTVAIKPNRGAANKNRRPGCGSPQGLDLTSGAKDARIAYALFAFIRPTPFGYRLARQMHNRVNTLKTGLRRLRETVPLEQFIDSQFRGLFRRTRQADDGVTFAL
jgi:hypothetical protein